jgi:effector-binding domain-containing protein
MKGGLPMSEIAVHQLDPRPTAAVRVTGPMSELDLGALFGEHLPNIAHRLADMGVEPGGAPYGRYHEFGPERAIVEIGIPTSGPASALRPLAEAEDGELAASELPGGEVAVAVHRGSYDGLAETYARLEQWFGTEGRKPAGAPWESYVDDPFEVEAAAVRTEVCWPVG